MNTSVFDGLASAYDLGMWPLERLILARLRRRIFRAVQGTVLELGVGTGVNLPLYPEGCRVVGVDFSLDMLQVARRKPCRAVLFLSQADVHYLPFPTATFDQVLGSLLFCSVADPLAALREVRRVLCSPGRLLLLEHVRGMHPLMARLTDWLDHPWHAWSRSCHLNRETAATVEEAGFTLVHSERHGLGLFQIIEAVSM